MYKNRTKVNKKWRKATEQIYYLAWCSSKGIKSSFKFDN